MFSKLFALLDMKVTHKSLIKKKEWRLWLSYTGLVTHTKIHKCNILIYICFFILLSDIFSLNNMPGSPSIYVFSFHCCTTDYHTLKTHPLIPSQLCRSEWEVRHGIIDWSLTISKLRCPQEGSSLGALGRICFQAHAFCWRNSVPSCLDTWLVHLHIYNGSPNPLHALNLFHWLFCLLLLLWKAYKFTLGPPG